MVKRYYPINFDIDGKKCLVVGGGTVAERKVGTLIEFGARVVVIAPHLTGKLKELTRSKKIVTRLKKYSSRDLRQAVLVIGATSDRALNKRIARDAAQQNVLVNIVDDPELCSFIVPSKIKRGPLVVAISTSGLVPALAKALRIKLEKIITPELGRLTNELGKIRRAGKKKFAAA